MFTQAHHRLVSALILLGGLARPQPAFPSYTGDFPDPFVLPVRGGYLAFGTNTGGANVPVLTSEDLSEWRVAGDALPVLPSWAVSGASLTWAPAVLDRGDGTWVLYFVARDRASGLQCIGAALATEPAGPFQSASGGPLVCQTELGGSIDPYPFRDTDGSAILLWKNDGNCCGLRVGLWSQRLGPDAISLVGPPAELLVKDRPWEEPLIENPALVVAGGTYHLLYSGGWWESPSYAIGHATCAGPFGPCAKVGDQPVLASGAGAWGPGGEAVFSDHQGKAWLAYHAWTAPQGSYAAGGVRSLRLEPIELGPSTLTLVRP
jgi:beta-xylosidase